MSYVEIRGLSKRFGPTRILNRIDCSLERGELVTLLGPSGCGKTTLLRCVAGLETLDEGTILAEGEEITNRPAQKRNIGMVFQSYALFPNLSVFENVAFGLSMARVPREKARRRVEEVLRMVEMDEYRSRRPSELSGGQRQRVALARALAPRPRILLLDEPLSALDARIRRSLREQIRRIQRETGVTTLFVTHDQEEALEISDRIFLMDAGRVVQQGRPEEVYARPASEFVARFMGSCNILGSLPDRILPPRGTEEGIWAIRPESVRIRREGHSLPEGAKGPFRGKIRSGRLLGNVIRYDVDWDGDPLMVDELNRASEGLLPEGTAVELFFEEKALIRL